MKFHYQINIFPFSNYILFCIFLGRSYNCYNKSSILQLGSAEQFMQESKFLIHGNGKEKPPTGFMFEKEQMKGLYFNQSPTKVCRI